MKLAGLIVASGAVLVAAACSDAAIITHGSGTGTVGSASSSSSSTSAGGGTEAGTACGQPAPSMCPMPANKGWLSKADVPSGTCSGSATCDFATYDPPCPPPPVEPEFTWHCACVSCEWQCTMVSTGAHTC